MTFRLDYLPPMNTAHTRRHWSVAHRERQKAEMLVFAALPKGARSLCLKRASIVLTRHSAKEPDAENLSMSFKGIVDSLVTLGVLEDDSPRHLVREYRWSPAKRGEGFVTVEVT